MALNGKYINVKQVLEELYADNGYQHELPWVDCLMWVEEALELIGHPRQYVRKVTGHKENPDLDIDNYKAKLPCDFHKLERIAVDGRYARYAGNSFHHLLSGDCCDIDSTSGDLGIEYRDNFGNTFDPALSATPYTEIGDATFDLNNEYLTLNVKEGKVCIAYLAFPLDDSGYPLIPDDIGYKLAVKKYLTMKLDYIEFRRGDLQPAVYQHSEQEWAWYVGQAGNRAKMPGVAEMESIKNQMLRLKPNVAEGSFKYLGSKEIRKRH
jgi:hypothetical protein